MPSDFVPLSLFRCCVCCTFLHDLLTLFAYILYLAGFTQENPDTESRSQNSAKWQATTSGKSAKAGQAWKTYTLKTVGSIHTFLLQSQLSWVCTQVRSKDPPIILLLHASTATWEPDKALSLTYPTKTPLSQIQETKPKDGQKRKKSGKTEG